MDTNLRINATYQSEQPSSALFLSNAIKLYQEQKTRTAKEIHKEKSRLAKKVLAVYRKTIKRARLHGQKELQLEKQKFITEMESYIQHIRSEVHKEYFDIAMSLAREVIQSEITSNKEGIKTRFKNLTEEIDPDISFCVNCHPTVCDEVKKLTKLPVREDQSLEAGCFKLISASGSITNDIHLHFELLEQQLRQTTARHTLQ